jgi:LPS O-antigen subunit length determinant protein (WzzB/FepE family)
MSRFSKSIALIVITTVIGALAGLAIAQFLQPRWLAKMTIEIGQVTAPQMAPQLVESQLSAIDRYNLPSSRMLVLKNMGLQPPFEGNKQSNVIFDSMRATAAKGPDLIELEVSAYSRAQARDALMASFNAFVIEHQKKFEPSVNAMKGELESASSRLTTTESIANQTLQAIHSNDAQGGASGTSPRDILLSNTVTLVNGQVLVLRQQITALKEALSPLRTYPTQIVGTPYVPQRPSTPRRLLLVAVGCALGLMVGVAFLALRHAWRSSL